jgi:hypothetical protein
MAKRNKDLVAKAVQSRPAVRVEWPGEDEAIARPSYTVHIAAMPGADGVEISIDSGDWMACREALGLWWYDWSGFEKGDYELSARTRMGDGISIISAPRRFSVN